MTKKDVLLFQRVFSLLDSDLEKLDQDFEKRVVVRYGLKLTMCIVACFMLAVMGFNMYQTQSPVSALYGVATLIVFGVCYQRIRLSEKEEIGFSSYKHIMKWRKVKRIVADDIDFIRCIKALEHIESGSAAEKAYLRSREWGRLNIVVAGVKNTVFR